MMDMQATTGFVPFTGAFAYTQSPMPHVQLLAAVDAVPGV